MKSPALKAWGTHVETRLGARSTYRCSSDAFSVLDAAQLMQHSTLLYFLKNTVVM